VKFTARTSLYLICFAVEEWRDLFEKVARDAGKRRGERHSLHAFTRQQQ
jgi:hypothetical protein